MPYNTITCDKGEPIVWLTLHRPNDGNLLNLEMANEVRDACLEIDRDEAVRAVILTGAGEVFCSGADLAEYASAPLGNLDVSNPAGLSLSA